MQCMRSIAGSIGRELDMADLLGAGPVAAGQVN